jgi:hypothetical protein
MVSHARFHCGSDAQSSMNPAKIVVNVMERDRFKLYHYPITKVEAGCVSTEGGISV